MPIDYNNLKFQIPERCFNDEQSLVATLAQETPADHVSDAPTFLFRGQRQRFVGPRQRRWPADDRLPVPKFRYTLESVIPTDYRGMEDALATGTPPSQLERQYGNVIANVRTSLVLVAAREIERRFPNVRRWIDDCVTNRKRIHRLLSLGQHYGLPTQYLDATSSWEVALWFATRDFATGKPLPTSNDAVIYRFQRERLEEVLKDVGVFLSRPLRLVDIRDTPPDLGRRASGQKGWSIIGLEHPELLSELIRVGGIEALQFTRTGAFLQQIDRLTPDIARLGEPLLQFLEQSKDPAFWPTHAKALEQRVTWPRGELASNVIWAKYVWGR